MLPHLSASVEDQCVLSHLNHFWGKYLLPFIVQIQTIPYNHPQMKKIFCDPNRSIFIIMILNFYLNFSVSKVLCLEIQRVSCSTNSKNFCFCHYSNLAPLNLKISLNNCIDSWLLILCLHIYKFIYNYIPLFFNQCSLLWFFYKHW